ncbi:MAG: hypothetical protein FWE09_06590, partial [Treponema sp.]|nr:hypothetical protein [Treponema sp.]
VALFSCLVVAAQAQAVSIDDAISGAARHFADRVQRGGLVAVLNIESDSSNLSGHIISRLNTELSNTGALRPVLRGAVELEAARLEFEFQYSGFVEERDQIRIGSALGANTIITGSVVRGSGNTFRLTVNAVDLERFVLLASYTATFHEDADVRAVMAGYDIAAEESRQRAEAEQRARTQASYNGAMANFRARQSEINLQRIRLGAANMAFGRGAFDAGYGTLGYTLLAGQVLGVAVAIPGAIFAFIDSMPGGGILITGAVIYGGFALIGWVAPIFLIDGPGPRPQRPRNVSSGGLPVDIGLLTSNSGDINAVRVTHSIRF